MTCNNQQKSSENLLNKRAQIFKNIRCELCVTCRRRTDFSRCLRHDAPTKTSTYTDSLIRCMCVCLFILWWAMEVSPATAYCCVPLVLTGREGLWDRSGDSGLSEYSRCCQSFLLHTSHFLGHYACCTHSYINRWTIKKKINHETRHSWRHWYFQQLEVEHLWDQNFHCIQTKRKIINKLERNKTYVSLFSQWEPFQ